MPQVAVAIAIQIAIAVALGLLSRLLAPKPNDNKDRSGRKQILRSSVAPRTIIYGEHIVSGVLTFADTTGTDNSTLYMAITIAGHECESITDVYFNDTIISLAQRDSNGVVVSGPYANKAQIVIHLGTATQAADPTLLGLSGGRWTAAHQGKNICYIVVKLTWDIDVYPTGIPNIRVRVKGKKVWDPRLNPGSNAVKAYSVNASLCQLDFLMDTTAYGVLVSEIHESSWNAAANICDEAVALKVGGVENRYICNGAFQLEDSLNNIMEDILTSSAGSIVFQQDKFRGYAGAATVASDTITEADILGEIEVITRATRSSLFNAVRGVYNDETNQYLPNDFPPITNALYQANDNGERLWLDIKLPFTIGTERAQRIAKLMLDAFRQGITVTLSLRPSKFSLAPMDTVTVTIADLGWSAKKFRVLTWSLNPDSSIAITIQEEADSIYTLDLGDIILTDPAPDTNLPNVTFVNPPGAPVVSEILFTARSGGGVKSKVTITWLPSIGPFLSEYQPEYKANTDTEWILLTKVNNNSTLQSEIIDITPGQYDFRIKALNSLGVASAYTENLNKQVAGLSSAPANLVNLTVGSIGGFAILNWEPLTELDVIEGGFVEFRHSKNASTPTWTSSIAIGNAVTARATSTILPLKPGSYLAKVVDSSGIKSTTAVNVSTNAAELLTFANLSTINEAPSFAGTKTDVLVVGSILRIDNAGKFNDIPDLDLLLTNIDASSGILTSGTYDFASNVDRGSVDRVRIRTVLDAVVTNQLDQFDDRDATLDDWEEFDGVDVAAATVEIWVRETNDDPNASAPTWSAYQRLESAEYEARGFEFQARLFNVDSSYNIEISQMTVEVDNVTSV